MSIFDASATSALSSTQRMSEIQQACTRLRNATTSGDRIEIVEGIQVCIESARIITCAPLL